MQANRFEHLFYVVKFELCVVVTDYFSNLNNLFLTRYSTTFIRVYKIRVYLMLYSFLFSFAGSEERRLKYASQHSLFLNFPRI